MASRDLHHSIKQSRCLSPGAIIAGNATKTGEILDRSGYDSVEVVASSGTITDSTFTCTLYESDDPGMAGRTAVPASNLIGSLPTFVASEDDVVKRVGVREGKRYLQAEWVQSGATTGGFLSAVYVQGHPHTGPVA